MIFCFGGVNDNPEKIQWGFLKKLGVPHVDLYDEDNGFYQGNILENLEYLSSLSSGPGLDRFLGVSMGGFGALMFSALMQTGPALALSPQTNLSVPEKLHPSKQKYLKRLPKLSYGDLSKLEYPEGTYVVYPKQNAYDRHHGESMKHVKGVTSIPMNYKSHGWFKDDVPRETFRSHVLGWLETKIWKLERN